MDEQVAAVKASNGGKQRAQSDQQALKLVNDAISRSIQSIKLVLHSLKESCGRASSGLPSNSGQRAVVQSALFQQICEDILKFKTELQTIATQFKKKINIFKENRTLLNYEAKSNSMGQLRDETLSSLHSLVNKVDHVQQALV